MLTNQDFLDKILDSFKVFITVGTSRSTAKLKPLHGAIAADIAERLGNGYYVKSQGYDDGKEAKMEGRYVDKKVDITIKENGTDRTVAGIAVKFVMQNYSQNSNNYFENMLGETANIRTANCPYFQIFIVFDKLPYYNNKGVLSKWEKFNDHNISKYCKLSDDDSELFYHTPNKTLIFVVHAIPEITEDDAVDTRAGYLKYYKANAPHLQMTRHQYSDIKPGGTVILNDYEKFMDKVYHTIMAR